MKIADVNEFYAEQGGGVRTYVNAKLEAAAKSGIHLSIIAPGAEDKREARSGGEIVWVKSPPMPFDPRYYVLHRKRAVHEWLQRLSPSVVEGSSPWTSGWFAASAPTQAIKSFIYHQDPVAVFAHTLFDRVAKPSVIDSVCTPYWAYTRRLAAHFDVTVVASQWLAGRLHAHGINNATAVPFGIDRQWFSPSHRSADVRQALLHSCGLPPNAKLLIAMSRHHPEKRLGTVIRAARALSQSADPSERVGLVVFGDGPFRRQIERVKRGAPHVHLAGSVRDRAYIAQALASADALVHGSAAETYGFVVAEALCSGTPVVVPNRGGAFDLAAPDCSETYPPGDVTGCVEAVRRLFARDALTLSAACLSHAALNVGTQAQHFTRLFALYELLVADKHRATS